MKYQELLILLSCHSLEDFPTYHDGEAADGLLAGWSAMWHPALIASAGAKPSWCRVDAPPSSLNERLLIAPSVAASQLPTGFAQRTKDEGGVLIRKLSRREEIVAAALQPLGPEAAAVDSELAADFLALGYCYLQVQLLTRQMRYSSNLDEVYFSHLVVDGANAVMAGNADLAREKLTACFSLLAQERDHYYPVDAYILDLTLVAPTTIGSALRAELSRENEPVGTTSTKHASNLLLSGETLAAIAEREPQTLATLKTAVCAGAATVIGGEVYERRWSLLACETMLYELRRGIRQFEATLGQRPLVYGRRRFGLIPALPSALTKLGFTSALHATLDEGRFPLGSQFKTRWEGRDGSVLDAIARAPLDANQTQTFLSWGIKLGESMDGDHVATLMIAHWPGQASPWLADLRRIARYTPALGRFVTLDQYFKDTVLPGTLDRFESHQYLSPYLKQAIIRKQPDPISSVARYWSRRAAANSAVTLDFMATLLSGAGTTAEDCATSSLTLRVGVDEAADEPAAEQAARPSDQQLDGALKNAADRCSAAITKSGKSSGEGLLVLNPCSFSRRVAVDISGLKGLPAVGGAVIAAAESVGGKQAAVVEVPSLGFVYLAPGPASSPSKKPSPVLAEGPLLQNEFFVAQVNTTTGSLQAIRLHGVRGNRLSQQLALRIGDTRREGSDDGNEGEVYSVMAADTVEVTHASPVFGEITARGRLLNRDGKPLAKFVQKFQITRGNRVLVVEVELEPLEEPRADPWNSYYASRFAWADEASDLYRLVNETRQPVSTRKFEAPQYVEIDSGEQRTAILTGGLPFHRRIGMRMFDMLLIPRGESSRRFRFGIGVDLTHPHQDAQSLLVPTAVTKASPPPATSGWLFHIDAKSVVATNWEPLLEAERVVGYRVRLLETTGKPARVKLSAFRAATTARQVDFLGNSLGDCQVEEGAVRLDMAAHEWVSVEVRW